MGGWTEKELGSVVVAAIAATVALIAAFFTLYSARRSTCLNTVTAERSKWIDKLRANIARVVKKLKRPKEWRALQACRSA